MMKNKNKIKTAFLMLFIGVIISILLCGLFVFNVTRKVTIDINNYKIEKLNDNYLYDINAVKTNNKYSIEGYLYKKNTNINTSSIHVVIKDEDNKYYKMPTYVVYLENITNDISNTSINGWFGFKTIINGCDVNSNLYILENINSEEILIDLNIKLGDIVLDD